MKIIKIKTKIYFFLCVFWITSMCFMLETNATTLYADNIVSYLNKLVDTTNSSRAGLCLQWAFDQYKAMGATSANVGNGGACCAKTAAEKLVKSTSKNNIPIGAAVFFDGISSQGVCNPSKGGCGRYPGHIGIYVGNGDLVSIHGKSSGGAIKKESIATWEKWGYKYLGWGIPNNVTLNDVDPSLISLWGVNDNDSFSGKAKIWAKRFNNDNNHYAIFYLDGQPITGHISADEGGYFSKEIDTNKYANGKHTISIEYAYTEGSGSDSRTIVFDNNTNINLWGINEGDTFTGKAKLWAKRFNDDDNHYAVFYIDGNRITGNLSSDASGYFSVEVDTTKYSNGSHTLKVEYACSIAGSSDSRTINFSNNLNFIGFESNNKIGGKHKIQLQSTGYEDSIKVYIDTQLIDTVSKKDGYYTFWLDTNQHSQSMHKISARVQKNSGEEEVAVVYLQFSQEYILAIDCPAENEVIYSDEKKNVSGWLNDSATGEFYLDDKLIKTVYPSELFFRSDIEYTGGYQFELPMSGISEGTHVLALKSITSDREAWGYRTFEVKKSSKTEGIEKTGEREETKETEENNNNNGNVNSNNGLVDKSSSTNKTGEAQKNTGTTSTSNDDIANRNGNNQSAKSKSSKSDEKNKKVILHKIQNKKGRKIVLSWKTPFKAPSFEIQIATDKRFKKNKKVFFTTSRNKESIKLSKKYKKKKVYVRIRAIKYDRFARLPGKWSNIKKIKIKK